MSTKSILRVTCDVCGRTKDIDGIYSPWFKKMWVRVPEHLHGVGYEYECKEVDICDECLEKAVRPKFVAGKYIVEE